MTLVTRTEREKVKLMMKWFKELKEKQKSVMSF